MPKSISTWFPFYVGDYLADTIALTHAEHGAYLLAMLAYWRRGGPLPDAEAKAIMGPEADALARYFSHADGHWRHKRIDAELAKAANMQEQRSQAGRASAAIRWGPREDNDRYNSVVTSAPRKNAPSPSPSPSQLQSQSQEDSYAPKRGATACHRAIDQWNSLAKEAGLRPVIKRTQPRLKAINARLTETDGAASWSTCLAKIRASPFLCGKANGNGHAAWQCSFDWIIKPSNFTKVIEGNYDGIAKPSWESESTRIIAAIEQEPDQNQG